MTQEVSLFNSRNSGFEFVIKSWCLCQITTYSTHLCFSTTKVDKQTTASTCYLALHDWEVATTLSPALSSLPVRHAGYWDIPLRHPEQVLVHFTLDWGNPEGCNQKHVISMFMKIFSKFPSLSYWTAAYWKAIDLISMINIFWTWCGESIKTQLSFLQLALLLIQNMECNLEIGVHFSNHAKKYKQYALHKLQQFREMFGVSLSGVSVNSLWRQILSQAVSTVSGLPDNQWSLICFDSVLAIRYCN